MTTGVNTIVPMFHPYWITVPTILQPTNPTEFWTMITAVCTVVLTIIAGVGLISLLLAKRDMWNRATRDAVQSAIDHCDEMASELIPMHAEVMEEIRAQKRPLFVSDTSQVSFEATEEKKKINNALEWLKQLDPQTIEKTIPLMNKLETWSMAFTHNPSLADENVAFKPCSTVFCQMVMSLYPMFLTQRRVNPASGPYQNVVTLFQGWYAKTAQGPALEQLRRLQVDGSRLPPTLGN